MIAERSWNVAVTCSAVMFDSNDVEATTLPVGRWLCSRTQDNAKEYQNIGVLVVAAARIATYTIFKLSIW